MASPFELELDGPQDLPIDCVIPAHPKDFATLGRTITSLKKCCPGLQQIVVITPTPWAEADKHGVSCVHEGAEIWPFRLSDFEGCACQPGWLLQQVLKLHAPLLLPGLAPNVLVCDADVLWLQPDTKFFEMTVDLGVRSMLCTFSTEACPPIRSAVDLHRYDVFLPALLPGLAKPRPGAETAVCHHAAFQRDVLQALFTQVEASRGQPFWMAFRDAARECEGRASEYELYHAFARCCFPKQTLVRSLPFAVVADADAAVENPPAADLAFLVEHSHLRGLSAADLRDREGVINGNTGMEIARKLASRHSPEVAALLVGSGMF